jgi:hypothetical protein
MWRGVFASALYLALCAVAEAQTVVQDRPGPYVVDIRAATSSLPRDSAFFPPVPSSTAVPSRGYGIDAGAHVYLMQFGTARLGLGASLLRARGTISPGPPEPDSGDDDDDDETSSTSAAALPDVATLLTTIGPQVSVNFGRRAGWSYLSAGIGRARITTRTSAFVDEAGQVIAQTRLREGGTRSSINVGGGARWFAKSRLAFSFDVRFHIIGAGGNETSTPRTTLVAVAAGISLR